MKPRSYGESYNKKQILKSHLKQRLTRSNIRSKEKSPDLSETEIIQQKGANKPEANKSLSRSPDKLVTKLDKIRAKLKPINSIVKVSAISIASGEETASATPQLSQVSKPVLTFADLYNMSSKEYSTDLCKELEIKERPLSQISEVHPLTKGFVYNKDSILNMPNLKLTSVKNTLINNTAHKFDSMNNLSRFSSLKDVSQEERKLLAEIQSLTLSQNQKMNKILIQSDQSGMSHQSSFSQAFSDLKKFTPMKPQRALGLARPSAPLKERKISKENQTRSIPIPSKAK
jgi:hypothetical protein